MNLSHITISSERLRMVPISEDYLEIIFHEFSPEITRYMLPRSPKEITETKDYIHSVIPKMSAGEELVVVILDKDTHEFLGAGGIHNIPSKKPNFGIWIKKSAHGHHYGREAVTALKNWAQENLDYEYLLYPVDKRNIPSRKIAESLGGVILREFISENMSGNILEEVEYRIDRK